MTTSRNHVNLGDYTYMVPHIIAAFPANTKVFLAKKGGYCVFNIVAPLCVLDRSLNQFIEIDPKKESGLKLRIHFEVCRHVDDNVIRDYHSVPSITENDATWLIQAVFKPRVSDEIFNEFKCLAIV